MAKPVTPQSSADQRQRLLKLYQRHHRSPPGSTLELAQWIDSDEGRAALQEAKAEQKADEAKADATEKRRHRRSTGERTIIGE